MARDAVELDPLFAQHDVAAHFECAERRVKMGAHEVRKIEFALRRPHKERPSRVHARDVLARDIVVGKQAAAVLIALFGSEVELVVKPPLGDIDAEELGEFAEEIHPAVDVRRAVVAVDHADKVAHGRRHEVDLGIRFGERLFEHDHREHARARRDVARALFDGIGRDHARACVALGRAERDTGL